MPTARSSGRIAVDPSAAKYRVLTELGKGGMARVFLAVAKGPGGFHKLVVLKTIRPELAVEDELLQMFFDEARLAARLDHPNVVQTFEVVESAGRPVIVMEYLEGHTLAEVVGRARAEDALNSSYYLQILAEALAGLHYAHEATDFDGTPLGLVHRDVTPHNVFLTYDGHVKLLDFGIAKAIDSSHHTSVGVLKGKLRFMPPEQILGDPLDRRADIFSVGAMLWEAVTGQEMWAGTPDGQVMQALINQGTPKASSVHDVDPDDEAIIERALAWDKADRFATAAQLEAELRKRIAARGPVPTQADLAQWIQGLFQSERAQLRKVVDAGVKDANANTTYVRRGIIAYPPTILTPTGTSVPPEAQPRRTWVVAVLAILVALGGVGTGLAARRTLQTADEAAGTSPTHAPTPSAGPVPLPTAPRPVEWYIAAEPSHAVISIDGRRVHGNPHVAIVPADGVRHIVRVEATGHVAREDVLLADRDGRMSFVLPPVAAPNVPSSAHPSVVSVGERTVRPKVAPRPAPSTPPAPPPRPACEPPYYFIDSAGIRRIRTECLD